MKATVVKASAFDAESLKGQRVLVLANVERLEPSQTAAVSDFLERGGGVLVAPGDRTDIVFANDDLYQDGKGWLPALIGGLQGRPAPQGGRRPSRPPHLHRPGDGPVRRRRGRPLCGSRFVHL